MNFFIDYLIYKMSPPRNTIYPTINKNDFYHFIENHSLRFMVMGSNGCFDSNSYKGHYDYLLYRKL